MCIWYASPTVHRYVVSAASAKYKTRIGAQRRPATAHRHIGADVPMCADACFIWTAGYIFCGQCAQHGRCFSELLLADIRRLSVVAVMFLYQITVLFTTKHNNITFGTLFKWLNANYVRGGGGSQQREVADGADAVFTDTGLRPNYSMTCILMYLTSGVTKHCTVHTGPKYSDILHWISSRNNKMQVRNAWKP